MHTCMRRTSLRYLFLRIPPFGPSASLSIVKRSSAMAEGRGGRSHVLTVNRHGVETITLDSINDELAVKLKFRTETIQLKIKKEPVLATVELKIPLHGQDIEKIRKKIYDEKGVEKVYVDSQRDSVVVIGTMDKNKLRANLVKKLTPSVEILPPREVKVKRSG